MVRKWWVLPLIFLFTALSAPAQRIVYSDYDREDTRRMNFEVAGKVGGNFLIYKSVRNKSWITVLDNDMVQLARVEQDYVPDNDRMINADFFPYGDFCYMIYQYQKKNIVYCMASRIGADGKKIGEVMQLDTTQIGFAADNKIYTVLGSEDKSRLIVFKINSKDRSEYKMTTLLYNDKLELLKKSRILIPMKERNDYLSDFYLDNDGDLVFCKFLRNSGDIINNAAFIVKPAQSDTLVKNELNLEKTWLDEIRIKVDNYNKRYFLTSLYYKEKKGNIDGYYFYVWDKTSARPVFESTYAFPDELRKEARGNASFKMAFNDYFIRNIITRKDGGFIISSEAYYTSSRFNSWNRWDYMYGSPFWTPRFNDYYFSPYYSNFWWGGNRWNSNQAVRHHADNIAVLSFTNQGQLEWSNVLGKNQYNDESSDLLSYQIVNTGGQLHFLFNQQERRNNLLSDFSISPGGELVRSPTLKNLDKGYEFMPKYGKQVSARQIIIPCLYRNYICFAKIDYN